MPILSAAILVGGLLATARLWTRGLDPSPPEEPAGPASRSDPAEVVPEESRAIALAVCSLSLATAGGLAASTPLWALSAAPLSVIAIPQLQDYVRQIREDDRRNVALLDLVGLGGALLAGQFAAAALWELFILAGVRLTRQTRRSSEQRLLQLFGEQPRSAWLVRDGVELEVPLEALSAGDVVRVVAGGVLPVDGVVVRGAGRVDERALTGEAQPADKGVGDPVLASTLLLEGELEVRCERAGAESVASELHEILAKTCSLTDTLSTKGDALVEAGAGPTLALTALTLPLLGVGSAIAVSHSAFGDGMRMAAPLAVLRAVTRATEHGLLIKDGRALEQCAQLDTILFDKTGTLTQEQLVVGELHVFSDWQADRLLASAAALEERQSHPIARAILQAASDRGLALPLVEGKQLELGAGLRGHVDGRELRVGSRRMMQAAGLSWSDAHERREREVHDAGAALVWVAAGAELVGAVELWPVVRPEAVALVRELEARGYRVAVVSGDRQEPTERVARALGIQEVFAEVLPGDKAAVVRGLREEGRTVCFVGDGLNDTIALKEANVSVSIQGATSVAMDTASVVLMSGELGGLIELLDISEGLHENLRTGTQLSVLPGLLCVAGVYVGAIGILGAILLYDVSVAASVANAMRPLKKPEAPRRRAS
ncbi:MAG: heavy metal translocating P-type ATPase [Alphaproteobacteria bacterium]|nr:heavy metal translocating P-type ATPase [Alphaproteobacteria bacterium]